MINTSFNLPNNHHYNYNKCQTKLASNSLAKNYNADCYTPSFKGHCGGEFINILTKPKILIQETAFFRQFKTLEFVKEYAQKTFKGKDEIRILDGACSTGEETWTLAMMFDDLAQKVKITGFDLGSKAVKRAQKSKFTISQVNDYPEFKKYIECDAFKDSYLAFDPKEALSKEQIQYKKIFNKFFTGKPSQNSKKSIGQIIKEFFIGKKPMEISETKAYQLKPEKAGKCRFIQGDITQLNKIAEDKKTDVLFFRNALYHLITKESFLGRFPKPENESRPILEKVFGDIYNKLSQNGIFVIGENESNQCVDVELMKKVLVEKGFKPIFKVADELPCVWQKVEK